jgi:hypothetical protein
MLPFEAYDEDKPGYKTLLTERFGEIALLKGRQSQAFIFYFIG